MRFSYRPNIFLIVTLILFSCSGEKRGAGQYLAGARMAYEQGNYSLAKLKIDSIRILYPKSFEEIKAGFALMKEIRYAENRRNIHYCDSMLTDKYERLNEVLSRFDYVRDERYQEFGEYYPKIFPIHASLNHDGLRSGVGEKGILFIESILSGNSVGHNRIRVSTSDGNYAETLTVTSDGLNYRFKTIDKSYEIVRYSGESENGVAKFVYTFSDLPLTVRFYGVRTVDVKLADTAKKGIRDSFELSSLLLDIEQLKLEKEKSETLIRYLENNGQ